MCPALSSAGPLLSSCPAAGGSASGESFILKGEGDRVAVSPPEHSGGASAAKRLRDFAARLSDSEEADESSGSGRSEKRL